MSDTRDLPRPGKDIALKPTSDPVKDVAASRLPSTEKPNVERRFIAQLNKWLRPDSPDAVSVQFPDKIDDDMGTTEPGEIKRLIFIDSPDGTKRIGLSSTSSADSEQNPFRMVKVDWLDTENKKIGEIRFMHYGGDTPDHFSQEVMTSPSVIGDDDIRRWEEEGGRMIGATSPSQDDMLPDITTALEGGRYNDTLTQNALRYFETRQQATRIENHDAISGSEDSQSLPASEVKEIEK